MGGWCGFLPFKKDNTESTAPSRVWAVVRDGCVGDHRCGAIPGRAIVAVGVRSTRGTLGVLSFPVVLSTP